MKRNARFLAVATLAAMFVWGCSFGSVMNGIAKWLPVGEQAFSEIMAILQVAGVPQNEVAEYSGVAAKVQSDFGDIQNAVAAYNASPAASKATTLDKVVVGLQVLQSDLQTFEADARVVDAKHQQVIQVAVGAILTTLASLEAQISPSKSVTLTQAELNAPKTPGAFKKQFNAILAAGGFPEYRIP